MWLAPKKNDEFEVPYAGRVLRTHSGKTLIVDDDGNETWVTDSEVGLVSIGIILRLRNSPIDIIHHHEVLNQVFATNRSSSRFMSRHKER